MKKLFLPIVLISMASCTKEVSFQSDFSFTLDTTIDTLATINYPTPFSVSILPTRIVQGRTHTLTYSLSSGDGALVMDNDTLPENTPILLEELDNNFSFFPKSIGTATLNVTVENEESVISDSFNIDVEHNSFIYNTFLLGTTVNVNQAAPFNLVLFNDGPDPSVSYERFVYFLQNSGVIFENVDGQNTPIEQLAFNPITPGVKNYEIISSQRGDAQCIIQIRDSNGQIKNDTLIFRVR